MTYNAGGLLFIYALTTLHPGSGRAGEHVDLPIQRDEFGYPVIWGSSLRGSLRSYSALSSKDLAKYLYGAEPESEEVSMHPSAVSVHDARLLLLPARSLRGVWLYITSPHNLSYLEIAAEAVMAHAHDEARQAMGNILSAIEGLRKRSPSQRGLVVLNDQRYIVEDGKAIINETEFSVQLDSQLTNVAQGMVPEPLRNKLQGLALVNDDDMKELVRKSLLVQYRVRLDAEHKTVVRGALWSEEYVPQRTLFVSCVLCKPSAYEKAASEGLGSADGVYSYVKKARFVNLGGKESVGHGVVRLEWLP